MAIYNRYTKQQKYINGEPVDEYRAGTLIDSVEWETLQGCERGEEWRENGNTICEAPGIQLTLKVHADTLPTAPYTASDGCMKTEDMNVNTNTDGEIISTGSKTANSTGIFCEITQYKAQGGTWNITDMTDIRCIDGNPYVAEVHSVRGDKRYTKHYFDVGSDAVECYPVSDTTKKWETDGRYNHGCYLFNLFTPELRYYSTEDAMNILWGKLTPTWNIPPDDPYHDAGTFRYGDLVEYNVPDCGGVREWVVYDWRDFLEKGIQIPYEQFIVYFLRYMQHGENGCSIPQDEVESKSRYISSDKYAGIEYEIAYLPWTETGRQREGNPFDCTPFENNPDNRVIQWRLVDLDPTDSSTYICEDERTYRKMQSVTFTDDFGKTFVQYTEEVKKGEEITDAYNLCESLYYIMEADYVTPNTYTVNAVTTVPVPAMMEVSYDNYPGQDRTFVNTRVVAEPEGETGMWSGNFHVKLYYSKTDAPVTSPFNGVSNRLVRITHVDQPLVNHTSFFYKNTNTNYYTGVSLEGWDVDTWIENNSIDDMFNDGAGSYGGTSDGFGVDITGSTAAFKAKVRSDIGSNIHYTIIDND